MVVVNRSFPSDHAWRIFLKKVVEKKHGDGIAKAKKGKNTRAHKMFMRSN